MKTFDAHIMFLATTLTLGGCMTAAQHRAMIYDSESDRLTLGTVQRKVKIGMPASNVAAALGSPNIVTTDELRREVWIYDKIATDRAYSTSEGGIATLILGGGGGASGLGGGALTPYYNRSAGAATTSQRTLTVIIKFDEQKVVRDFAYHTSRF